MSDLPRPLDLLEAAVTSWSPHLRQDGGLNDPVFGVQTQYGTAYHAWCCAVLAARSDSGDGQVHRDRAVGALRTALAHTTDPDAEPHASTFDRTTASVTGRLNHRDFTWPALLKTHAVLTELGVPLDEALLEQVEGLDVTTAFRSQPPSNWAAVWMSGEFLRMRAGLSPTGDEEFDDWLDVFFAGEDGTGFDLDLGMYTERGLPNAYDLFTRAHLVDLLAGGWSGRNRERLEAFLVTGLHRSLAMQLSDGSMASGFRSAGQTWVLGAQVALFTAHRALGLGSEQDLEAARLAAWRAYTSLAQWQRADGVFSPVQNLLPPAARVGYEFYTSDGHYSPLALAFLASAVHAGFGADEVPTTAELDSRPAGAVAEGGPTHRGAAHRGRVSVAVQAVADDSYDASGVVDLTFGSGRWLQFVSASRHLSGGPRFVPGLATRARSGSVPVAAVCSSPRQLTSGPTVLGEAGLGFEATLLDGSPPQGATAEEVPGAGQPYGFAVQVTPDGIDVTETLTGWTGWRSLLVPFVSDLGAGPVTSVEATADGVEFVRGPERVRVRVQGDVESATVVPHGFENRRGWCGLVRIDVEGPGEELRWSMTGSTSDEAGSPAR